MTSAQLQLLLLLDEHIRRTGTAPSVRELARLSGRKGVGGTQKLLELLRRDGWIRKAPGRQRAIEVLRLPDGGVLRGPARMGAIERLVAELERHNAEMHAARCQADAAFAAWMLTTVEAAGLRVMDAPSAPLRDSSAPDAP